MQNMLNVQHLNRDLARRRLLQSAAELLATVSRLALLALAWILSCLILGIGCGLILTGCRVTLSTLREL